MTPSRLKYKDTKKRNSKFSSKYSDRIESIKQADEMIKLKEQKLKKEAREAKRVKKVREEIKEDKEILEFRREYEKSMREPVRTKRKVAPNELPKSQRGRKRKMQ